MRKSPCFSVQGSQFAYLISPAGWRASSASFAAPQCFAASLKFGRIVGLRLGLLGFYRPAVLIATEISRVKVEVGDCADRGGQVLEF